MAKAKAEVNKSQAIRDALKENMAMTAKEIVEYLKAKGVDTNEGLVYAVKRKEGGSKKKKKNKGGRPKGSGAPTMAVKGNGTLPVWEAIEAVETLADRLGGFDNLKKTVDALAKR